MKRGILISEIKVSDQLMDAIVMKYFRAQIINNERRMMNAVRSITARPWLPGALEVPDMKVTLKSKLDISESDALRYIAEVERIMDENGYANELPYFSLVSENATNEMRVRLRSYSYDDGVSSDDLEIVTRWFEIIDGKYLFLNP